MILNHLRIIYHDLNIGYDIDIDICYNIDIDIGYNIDIDIGYNIGYNIDIDIDYNIGYNIDIDICYNIGYNIDIDIGYNIGYNNNSGIVLPLFESRRGFLNQIVICFAACESYGPYQTRKITCKSFTTKYHVHHKTRMDHKS